ncbi:hypothetical protein [Paenibacillus sp. J2TS4]|uniref:hypothetical protein n=1 Tax=Paenibacillus sp. J2TS4 TaxID=2807194 RepID=UPI001B0565F9|nr:hypothetical protein [Paenibacillus sp. J2TS4]GIP33591.1 hypothetical protein J2TS4_28010 [Paenibacillus sp. J2TS4]
MQEDENKIGKDFAALIEMVADTTINLDKEVCEELQNFKPDCIVSDSLCIWGKLFAKKLKIKYICSTTSFAFNKHTVKMMKRGVGEIIRMAIGMPRINKKLQLLRANGYEIDNFISLIENDNNTNTIVYTSKEFQPMSEIFSDKYAFVGPSVSDVEEYVGDERRTVYISLSTVKIMSFIKAIEQILNDDTYKENAIKTSKSFKISGEAKKAADVILNVINNGEK